MRVFRGFLDFINNKIRSPRGVRKASAFSWPWVAARKVPRLRRCWRAVLRGPRPRKRQQAPCLVSLHFRVVTAAYVVPRALSGFWKRLGTCPNGTAPRAILARFETPVIMRAQARGRESGPKPERVGSAEARLAGAEAETIPRANYERNAYWPRAWKR